MNHPVKRFLKRARSRLEQVGRRSSIQTIAVCAAQVPFFRGGAELHVQALVDTLQERGYDVDLINIPFKWYPRDQLLKSIEVWRMLDLTESNGKPIDLIITTKFPSYFARHPNRVLWLIHQYRQAYDLFGTEFSELDPQSARDREFRDRLVRMDTEELRRYPRIFTNAQNTADRLKRFNGVQGRALYHPPRLAGRYVSGGEPGDFILSVGRLDKLKRVDCLLRSLRYCPPQVRCRIAGTGPEEDALKALAQQLELGKRVEFLGFVPDEVLIRLYAECGAVYFAPLDEDYGYITLEAFLSGKPVITARDSGGPLEFVEDGKNGIVLASLKPQELGASLGNLLQDKERCRVLGRAGYEKVQGINWDSVINTLLGGEEA